ncbi:MAG: SH3 domain-containing protein [Deltaproteobacteria bacterium]|nr:SH3 domain-containing protein [Deltaproteobacteria bacterium]
MMTGRLFSWNDVTTFFPNRRGSASIWLIASVCFVIVFVGIVFFLSKDQNSERKTPVVPATSKLEVREPIKPYTASNEIPSAAQKPESKSDVPMDKGLPEESEQQLNKPLKDDPSEIQDVRPEDPAGKGILSQELNKQEPDVSEQPLKTSESISPSPEVKPPLVAENAEPGPKESEPKEAEIPKSVSPPEASAPLEKTSTQAPEKTAEAAPPSKEKKLKAKEKNLKELVVTVVQGNVRKGPSVKEKVLFRIARGDKLQEIGQKGNWYEIRLSDGRSGWAHQTLFKTLSTPLSQVKTAKPETPKNGRKGVIKGIRTVVTDPNRAQIIFELNGYFPPEIMVIEGEVPRVVCDFFSVGLARGVKKNVQVDNGVVKRIRVGVHKGANPKTRVVLDLSSGQNYAVEQFFFEKEKYYALMVNRAAN